MTRQQTEYLDLRTHLLAVAMRLTPNRAEAEDLTQECLTRLLERQTEFDHSLNPKQYAATAMRHLWISQLRKRKISLSDTFETLQPVAPQLTPEQRIEVQEAENQVRYLISLLPERQRLVITLHDVMGLDYNEIERETQINQQNCRTLLSRARRTIREQFNQFNQNEI